MWQHWVMRASSPYEPFAEFHVAQKMWDSLGRQFPQMLAAVLMPNHLHLILPLSLDSVLIRKKLGGWVGGY